MSAGSYKFMGPKLYFIRQVGEPFYQLGTATMVLWAVVLIEEKRVS